MKNRYQYRNNIVIMDAWYDIGGYERIRLTGKTEHEYNTEFNLTEYSNLISH